MFVLYPYFKKWGSLLQCCDKNNISWDNVKDCTEDAITNIQLQKLMGVKTRRHVSHFSGMLDLVPTIIVNGVSDIMKHIQNLSFA